MPILDQLATAMASGAVEVVDLTARLESTTPVRRPGSSYWKVRTVTPRSEPVRSEPTPAEPTPRESSSRRMPRV